MKARSQAILSSPDNVFRLAVRFLAHRDRTIAQVEQFLTSRGVSSLQAKHAICRLSDLRYLDDTAYAQRYVENRLASRPMGQERLKAELQAKGIADPLASQVVADVFREIDEEIVAQWAIKASQRHGRKLTLMQVARLLHQRGFTQETIDHIMLQYDTHEERAHEE